MRKTTRNKIFSCYTMLASCLPSCLLGICFGFLSEVTVVNSCRAVCKNWRATRAHWTRLVLSPKINPHAVLAAAEVLCVTKLHCPAFLLSLPAPSLRNLANLTVFRPSREPDVLMSHIVRFTKLQKLVLATHKILTAEHLRQLSLLRGSLTDLDLTGCHLERECLSAFLELTFLKHLNLRSSILLDGDLAFLSALQRLETLDLEGCHLGDPALVLLSGLVNLRKLTFQGPISDLTPLSGLGSLRWLSLSEALFSHHLTGLGTLVNLEHFQLDHCDRLRSAALLDLRALPLLTAVEFHFCTGLAFGRLGQVPGLKSITVENCGVIRALSWHDLALESVCLSGTIYDEATAGLPDTVLHLTVRSPMLTKVGVARLCALPGLVRLFLDKGGCALSLEECRLLSRLGPHLALRLMGSPVSKRGTAILRQGRSLEYESKHQLIFKAVA